MLWSIVTRVLAARVTCLEENHGLERRESRFHLLPDPLGKHFARWIFETRNVVQVVMIELLPNGPPNVIQIAKIDKPAGLRVDLAANGKFNLERMSVEPRTLMTLGDFR